jgi:hypothetical protein
MDSHGTLRATVEVNYIPFAVFKFFYDVMEE